MTLVNESSENYFSIIEKAKEANRTKGEQYYEKHHIIPRALGGKNNKDNLVLLIPEEHYLCHSLLPDFCEGKARRDMIYAWNLLNNTREITGLKIIGPEKYGKLKREFATNISEQKKNFAQTEEGKEMHRLQGEKLRVFYHTEEGFKFRKRKGEQKRSFYQSPAGQKLAESQSIENKKFARTEEGKENHLLQSEKARLFYQSKKGKKVIKDRNEKISETKSNHTKKECPHCGRPIGPSNYKRHVDKYCKVLYPKKG